MVHCTKCSREKMEEDMVVIFQTAYFRQKGREYHLGICVECHAKMDALTAIHQISSTSDPDQG